ncbi:electron transfer flavoprotein subunit beta/FixA family protein [Oryzomicrobium sp.]|uniref:electron transfer flavoprotein subunit beta/FixA family protein n=1 Tax=Oryzomicrobium sp. TaxID=1911578 RepID=UPI0025E49EAA|nr:electron transfer flavoprotein subunit beta/FixA family protein [Oryzomicrobium sp.]MCE1243031.1 electron transfer flavoprotein subunit beta/FixA family protein [Oryzomicrobium sp.]
MHSVVCIKQVPDSAQIRVHPVTNTIMRQGVPAIVNPYDLFALEEALRLKDQLGGTVTVLSMGPPMAEAALRKCLAFGADDAILVSDRAFAGSDTLATSFALAATIRKIQENMPVDLIFTGKQTIDGDTAQVGPGIAKRLDFQLLTYASKIVAVSPAEKRITVERRAEGGVQVLETRLPCLITMLEGTNEMRFGDMADLFRAARTPVKVWDREAAGIDDPGSVGLKGSPTVVSKVFAPKPRAKRAEIVETADNDPAGLAVTLLAKVFTQHPKLDRELTKTVG